MAGTKAGIYHDYLGSNEVEGAYQIEVEGYPPDEAASLAKLQFRQSQARDLFLGAYIPDDSMPSKRRLIGYVCATASNDPDLSHESMSTHVPSGSSVCVHSVCVSPSWRRRGVGLDLLKEYIDRLRKKSSYERILLLTHENLKPLYEKAGFQWIGPSDVSHGPRPWFEMRLILSPPGQSTVPLPPAQEPSQELPPGLLEALQHSSRSSFVAKPLLAFEHGLKDVIKPSELSEGTAVKSVNKYDIVCLRDGCGSIILRCGVAQWVERSSVQMEPTSSGRHPLLPALPSPPETTQWWLAGPTPMVFENIGFSRAVSSQAADPTEPNMKRKLLICAECDLGPLGWCEEGTKDFWLACSRVGYRDGSN